MDLDISGQSLLPPSKIAHVDDAISLSTLGSGHQSQEPLLPETSLSSDRSIQQDEPRLPRRKLQGWRFGIASAASAAGSVLLINTVFVVAASARSPISSGIGILYQGSCNAVNLWSVVLHLVINILSSILLCGSNYTMQCLSAPTRGELDKAHSKGDWLDIGTPSMRNMLGRISRKRVALWWLLVISSVPIHFLFNSAIFKTNNAARYGVLLAGEKFLDMSSFQDEFDAWQKRSSSNVSYEYLQAFQSYSNKSTHHVAVENMTREDCIASYATQFIQDRGPVIAIAANFSDGVNRSFVDFEEIGGYGGLGLPGGNDSTWTSSWQCGQDAAYTSTPFCNSQSCTAEGTQCDLRSNQEREAALLWNAGSGWNNTAYDFRYCLSANVSGQCRLHFSLHILIVVIVCNLFKCIVMLWTLRTREITIVTLGDAITTFLDRPDAQSRQVTLISRLDMSRSDESLQTTWFGHLILRMKRMLSWNRRAVAATGRRRWTVTFLLCITGLSVTLWLLVYGASKLGGSGMKGFGTLDPNAIVTFGKAKIRQNGAIGLLYMVLLVNLPQFICTFLYFLYNSLVTSTLLAVEWNSYYLRQKGLRTSDPHGQQRVTYWLSLPYRYGIPMIIGSTTMHWLISQILFLSSVGSIEYNPNGTVSALDFNQTFTRTAYSCFPMIVILLLGFITVFFLLLISFQRLPGHMPLAGSCSLAIAAACHRPNDDINAAYLPVSWGETYPKGRQYRGHCCFTSKPVHEPVWALRDLKYTSSRRQANRLVKRKYAQVEVTMPDKHEGSRRQGNRLVKRDYAEVSVTTEHSISDC